ncbi:MAG: N-acetylmannosamine-6-phosphate 2-epimerase [Gemella morbillorum]|uniref:N-acetylmannosamine-6-phosphate 2-epimerase n=1 Tax=Gemella morbillorum TaxID=29391 RepID=UPI001CAAD1A5|nr:N-acetylmannosamine-6-phosphate 2-epimerase [Gemella morbillorum]MBF1210084.1 N-acetylmannosamine-6-phosphate 2-epimerase [Gemella morbillorum]
MDKKELYEYLRGELIVSCQALPGEPLYREEGGVMCLMAQAAKNAGVKAIRAQGIVDIKQIKEQTNLPVIGIIKKSYPGYATYITATMDEVDKLVEAGSDIIALDCTKRERGDGKTPSEFVKEIKEKYPNIVLMADISNLEEAIEAEKAGVDFVGTTMNGYTPYTTVSKKFDPSLVKEIVKNVKIPVIAEGKIHEPKEAKAALEAGAHCMVVGGAITRPQEITSRFLAELK